MCYLYRFLRYIANLFVAPQDCRRPCPLAPPQKNWCVSRRERRNGMRIHSDWIIPIHSLRSAPWRVYMDLFKIFIHSFPEMGVPKKKIPKSSQVLTDDPTGMSHSSFEKNKKC